MEKASRLIGTVLFSVLPPRQWLPSGKQDSRAERSAGRGCQRGRGLGGLEGNVLGPVLNLKRHSPEPCAPLPQAQTVCLCGPVLEPYPCFPAKNPRPGEKREQTGRKEGKEIA